MTANSAALLDGGDIRFSAGARRAETTPIGAMAALRRVSRRVRNRPLLWGEATAATAREAARNALREWYAHGYNRADIAIPRMQVDTNLKVVATMPRWQELKGPKNGYVMLMSLVQGTLQPTIIELDFDTKPCGGLTYRQLHRQIRVALRLEGKHSLRICPFRPWYRYMRLSFPIPEHRALPATDAQCTHLLGTTLLYYPYVHLSDDGPSSPTWSGAGGDVAQRQVAQVTDPEGGMRS